MSDFGPAALRRVGTLRTLDRLTSYLGSRHGALLLTLVALLLTYPFTGTHRGARWLLEGLWLLVLASLLRAVWHQRSTRRLVLALGLPMLVASALASHAEMAALYPAGLALRVALLGVILVGLFKNLLDRERITMDAVLGACCIYLMLGIGWSGIYGLLEWADASAFDLPAAAATTTKVELELVYFSLITMTTVGYGDITPASNPARMVAAIEALVAQLYLAIIIARLVGLELLHRDRPPA